MNPALFAVAADRPDPRSRTPILIAAGVVLALVLGVVLLTGGNDPDPVAISVTPTPTVDPDAPAVEPTPTDAPTADTPTEPTTPAPAPAPPAAPHAAVDLSVDGREMQVMSACFDADRETTRITFGAEAHLTMAAGDPPEIVIGSEGAETVSTSVTITFGADRITYDATFPDGNEYGATSALLIVAPQSLPGC